VRDGEPKGKKAPERVLKDMGVQPKAVIALTDHREHDYRYRAPSRKVDFPFFYTVSFKPYRDSKAGMIWYMVSTNGYICAET
jgi:hypothetical protein